MSVSFGPLNSFDDFFVALDASLAYVKSATYEPIVRLSKLTLEDLSRIQAYTFAGRKPLLADRGTTSFAYGLHRARDAWGPSIHRAARGRRGDKAT